MHAHFDLPCVHGKYNYIKKLGSGGTAVVYLVEHVVFKRFFAAKVIEITSISHPLIIEAFKDEIAAISTLDHPGIIRPYDMVSEPGYVAIILEYCQGGSLSNYIRAGEGIDSAMLLKVFKQSIGALAYCHQQGVAHRDIKPSNFLIDGYGRIKLADFGLSRFRSKSHGLNTFQGSVVYAAPELFEHNEYDPFKTDVWSLGVTMYQLCTGNLPWRSKTPEETYYMIRNKKPTKPHGMDEILWRVIKRMLSVDPADRPTMDEILHEPVVSNIELSKHSLSEVNVSTLGVYRSLSDSTTSIRHGKSVIGHRLSNLIIRPRRR